MKPRQNYTWPYIRVYIYTLKLSVKHLRQKPQAASQHVCSQFLNLVSGKNKKLLLSAHAGTVLLTPLPHPQCMQVCGHSVRSAIPSIQGKDDADWEVGSEQQCEVHALCTHSEMSSALKSQVPRWGHFQSAMWDPAYSSSQPLLPYWSICSTRYKT